MKALYFKIYIYSNILLHQKQLKCFWLREKLEAVLIMLAIFTLGVGRIGVGNVMHCTIPSTNLLLMEVLNREKVFIEQLSLEKLLKLLYNTGEIVCYSRSS